MNNKIKEKLLKYEVILKNTGWLSLIKIGQLIMPFVALPYIIKTVGTEHYGQVVFIQTIIGYFALVVNFGLDTTAVKDVSINRDSKEELSQIVSSVLGIKSILLTLAFICFSLAVFTIPIFTEFRLLAIFAFMTCVGDVLFPSWFYQGIEKMKYLTYIRFISIIFYTVTIFLFIKGVNDYIYIAILQSTTNILSGVVALFFLIKLEKISLVIPSWSRMWLDFKTSVPFFLSNVSASASSGISKLISGAFFSMHLVTVFDIAQKISLLAITPMGMLNQAIYPHISKTRDKLFAQRFLIINILLSLAVAIFIIIFAPYLIELVSNSRIEEAVIILRVLALYTFTGGIATYVGAPVLVSFGHPKPFTYSVILSFVCLMILYFIMFITNNVYYLYFAYVLVIAESIILLYRLYYCFKLKIFTTPWRKMN